MAWKNIHMRILLKKEEETRKKYILKEEKLFSPLWEEYINISKIKSFTLKQSGKEQNRQVTEGQKAVIKPKILTTNLKWLQIKDQIYILPQKFWDSSVYWQIYLSSAPSIWAPAPVNRGPYCNSSSPFNLLENTGFSTEYMKQKLCLHSGIETLKYQPSKNFLAVPSKWYLNPKPNNFQTGN